MPTVRAAIPALVLSAAVLLPHLGKAFTTDDTLFLFQAQHALQDPLHPAAFEVAWDERVARLSSVMPSGPVQAWLLVPCILAGAQEWVAHAIMLGLLWLGILATVSLARRVGLGPGGMTTAGLLVVASPTVMGLAGTAMPDVTAMTLGTAAIERILAWSEERRWHQMIAAVALLALAPLARSHALLLHGVAAILLLRASPAAAWGERARRLLPLLVALLVTVAVLVITRDPTPEAGNVGTSIARLSSGALRRMNRNLVAFPVHWALTTAFVLPWLIMRWRSLTRSRWAMGAAAVGTILGVIAALARRNNFPLPVALVAGLGAGVLADVLREAWRSRRWQEVALGVWLLLPLVVVPYVHFPSKYLVISVPAAAILVALEARRLPGLASRVGVGVKLVLGVSLGVAILRADAALADLGRRAAATLTAPRVAAGEQVWFVGHWGFQWYAERAGARPASLNGPSPSPGDTVVASKASDPKQQVANELLKRYPGSVVVERLTDAMPGGRIMNERLRVGFFSNGFGPLPWTWSSEPLDELTVWRLAR